MFAFICSRNDTLDAALDEEWEQGTLAGGCTASG